MDEAKAGWERVLEDSAAKAEAEVRRVIATLNDEVVPEVRRHGSRALRTAAEELTRLAERIEGRPVPGDSGDRERR